MKRKGNKKTNFNIDSFLNSERVELKPRKQKIKTIKEASEEESIDLITLP
jgi:hypothetical protein